MSNSAGTLHLPETKPVKKKIETLPGYFPARIQMVDTGEIFIAQRVEDIPAARSFKVLEVKIKEKKDE